jgi:hypothetical protein
LDSAHAQAPENADIPRRTEDMGTHAPVYQEDSFHSHDEVFQSGFQVSERDSEV